MWKVECRFALGGWGDAGWEEDDKPQRYATKAEAEADIEEFILEANADGVYHYDSTGYRAVRDTLI